ncbi:hypothetical protein [Mesorhizobium sp. 128a]
MTVRDIPQRSIERELLDLLLASMFKTMTDGTIHKFLFGKPGAPPFERRFGTEVHYSRRGLQSAAIFAREKGPSFLRMLPMGQIENRLTNFVSENYWHMMDDAFFPRFTGPFSQVVSESAKAKLEEAIKGSDLFKAEDVLTIYPIVPLTVKEDFDGGAFFLIAPSSLAGKVPTAFPQKLLLPNQFPPFSDHEGDKHTPAAWLGTRAKTSFAAGKTKATVLGALALLPHHFERYIFTGRKVFGGRASFEGGGYSFGFHASETPPLSEDIVLTENDKSWLEILAKKLNSDQKQDRKHTKALEYFYRAWGPSPVARFPTLFMALDAIFGDASQATQAVVASVAPLIGPEYDYARLKKMMSLRGSVMHGGAPDVVESDKYHDYYVDYGEDPISDLENIASKCLRQEIFGSAMEERPHTYAELIKEKTGRIV